MQTYFFKSALCAPGDGLVQWHSDVAISVDGGELTNVTCDTVLRKDMIAVDGVAIPAMVNVHSHAFQRGFAGLSEFRTAANDSFWTWRKLMYDFVGKLSPDDVFVITRQLYLEMISAGYSWVGEFHYLHNDVDGSLYLRPTEMTDAILRAAEETGIGICLLPVLYQRNGFGSSDLKEHQRRFCLHNEVFVELMEKCKTKITERPNSSLGLAVHSLRAVSPESIDEVLRWRERKFQHCPIHIHVAEQEQEVTDCLAATGKRPVEYLMSRFNVDANWCLIHATHMNQAETRAVANSKAVVGLCPTTEANLGDGFFPAADFLACGGSISIGSDSHCSLDPRDELRTLEYGQRLKLQRRAILGSNEFSVGRRLYESAAKGGANAIGVRTGKIAKGFKADLIVIDDQHPVIAAASKDRLLDRFVFTNAGNPIVNRMINGRWFANEQLDAANAKSAREFAALNKRLLT